MGDLCLSSCGKQGKSKVYSIAKMKTGTNKMSFVPSAHVDLYCIGETKRNLAVRKAEHENKSHNSEPARHLAKHSTHAYTWKIADSEKTTFLWEIMEDLLIACEKPTLNKQVHSFIAKLFPSGIT